MNIIWFAILVLLQVCPAGFREIDVFINSELVLAAEISGNRRAGRLFTRRSYHEDSSQIFLGEYESSTSYRQVYTIFPLGDLQEEGYIPEYTSEAEAEDEVEDEAIAENTSVPYSPFIVDFTSVLSDLPEIVNLEAYRQYPVSGANIAESGGDWTLVQERNRASLSNSEAGVLIVVYF